MPSSRHSPTTPNIKAQPRNSQLKCILPGFTTLTVVVAFAEALAAAVAPAEAHNTLKMHRSQRACFTCCSACSGACCHVPYPCLCCLS